MGKEIIMKSIIESIIGRKGAKGMTRVPDLREHDIVITGEPRIYIVLKDPEEIFQGLLNPKNKDMRQGILYCTNSSGSINWIPLIRYTETLEYENAFYNINVVYRGNYKWDPKHTRDICLDSNLFELIRDRKYNLIWERKPL